MGEMKKKILIVRGGRPPIPPTPSVPPKPRPRPERKAEEAPKGRPALRPPSRDERPPAPRPRIAVRTEPFIRPDFPELLAPAGSTEAYFAAVEAGADAVYLGLTKLNARERAENFTIDDLCRVLPHAHSRGIRVYLTTNIVVREEELPDAITLLHQVAPLRPDAVIVQDLGLMRIIRENFPSLPIHVSTQAGCASLAAAEQYARLGATRVILERHLRLPEVKRIVAKASCGVEVFVHGAMCYSYSGKCFFSSYLGGKSGNRGACVQPCRRVYAHSTGEDALFSMRDLSLIESIPDLLPLGLSSLKIEGRMKSADYVAGVVRAYRKTLDMCREGKADEGVRAGKALLAEVVGREATPGFLGGAAPGDMASGGNTGSIGEALGAVAEVSEDGWIRVAGAGGSVTRGDRLRAQFQADGSGKGFSALTMKALMGDLFLKAPFPVSPGDLLFRVGGGGRMEITRNAKREMEKIVPDGASFHIHVHDGVVVVAVSYGDRKKETPFRVTGGGRPESLPADAEARLRALYKGDLPLGSIRVEGPRSSVAWADVESVFQKAARAFDRDFYVEGKEKRHTILPTLKVRGERTSDLPMLLYTVVRPEHLPHLAGAEEVIPVVDWSKSVARDPSVVGMRFRSRGFFRLPPPFLEGDVSFTSRTVADALDKGYRRWIVSDVGHFVLFRSARAERSVELISDHFLYAWNTGSLSVLSKMGASRMVLPIEAPLNAIAAEAKFLYGLGIAVAYAPVPLMISRVLPAKGVRSEEVVSPKAERFVIDSHAHGSEVRSEAPYSASGNLMDLRAAGVRDFFVDLSQASPEEIPAILDALRADRKIPGTSAFNLFRGNF